VTGLIVAVNQSDGTRVVLSDREGLRLARHAPASSDVSRPAHREIPALLETVFGLPGFALGDNGRVTRRATDSE
jgi:hypothetical protein